MFYFCAFIKLLMPLIYPPFSTRFVCFLFFFQTADVCFRYFSYHDYLRIASNTCNVIGTFCGQQTGTSIRVAGYYALLTFHTDQSVQKTGFDLLFSYSVFPGELGFVPFHPTPRLWDFLLKEAVNLGKWFDTILLFIHKLFFVGSLCSLGHKTENENIAAYFCEVRRNNMKRRSVVKFMYSWRHLWIISSH